MFTLLPDSDMTLEGVQDGVLSWLCSAENGRFFCPEGTNFQTNGVFADTADPVFYTPLYVHFKVLLQHKPRLRPC